MSLLILVASRTCRASNVVQFQGACVAEGCTMLVTEFMEVCVWDGDRCLHVALLTRRAASEHSATYEQHLVLWTRCSLCSPGLHAVVLCALAL